MYMYTSIHTHVYTCLISRMYLPIDRMLPFPAVTVCNLNALRLSQLSNESSLTAFHNVSVFRPMWSISSRDYHTCICDITL